MDFAIIIPDLLQMSAKQSCCKYQYLHFAAFWTSPPNWFWMSITCAFNVGFSCLTFINCLSALYTLFYKHIRSGGHHAFLALLVLFPTFSTKKILCGTFHTFLSLYCSWTCLQWTAGGYKEKFANDETSFMPNRITGDNKIRFVSSLMLQFSYRSPIHGIYFPKSTYFSSNIQLI